MEDEKPSRFAAPDVAAAESQVVEQSKRIEFYLTEYSVELLAAKMQNGDFEVPNYQREFTWEPERKSRFLESVLMGLPIPFLFFWESPETGKLEIVDGSQRLRTIEAFVLGEFELGELEKLSLLEGFRFQDLPVSRQRKMKNRSIRGIVLNEHADEQARFDVFERINTGSKIANVAEIRRGALGGKFLDLVIQLANDAVFVQLAPVSDKKVKERGREELVTRFFAYGDGLEGYKDRVGDFLFDYSKKMNALFENDESVAHVYRERFVDTMNFVKDNFPWGFRRAQNGTATPRSRFEAISVGSFLALKESSELKGRKVQVEEWLGSKEFADVTGSGSANARSRILCRINFVRDRLVGA